MTSAHFISHHQFNMLKNLFWSLILPPLNHSMWSLLQKVQFPFSWPPVTFSWEKEARSSWCQCPPCDFVNLELAHVQSLLLTKFSKSFPLSLSRSSSWGSSPIDLISANSLNVTRVDLTSIYLVIWLLTFLAGVQFSFSPFPCELRLWPRAPSLGPESPGRTSSSQFPGTVHRALCVDVPLELDTEVRLCPILDWFIHSFGNNFKHWLYLRHSIGLWGWRGK